MTTEGEARELLRKAAATIDVAQRPVPIPVDPPRGRSKAFARFLPLAAAAVVVGIIFGAAFLTIGEDSPNETPSGEFAGRGSDNRPDEITAARAFTAFARGERSNAPWAPRITLLIEGQDVAVLDSSEADSREAWTDCPSTSTEYAGRECPVSPVSTIKLLDREGGEVVYEKGTPLTVGCSRLSPPPATAGTTVISIRPDHAHRDCFSDFAVALYVDSGGRITMVNFVLSSP